MVVQEKGTASTIKTMEPNPVVSDDDISVSFTESLRCIGQNLHESAMRDPDGVEQNVGAVADDNEDDAPIMVSKEEATAVADQPKNTPQENKKEVKTGETSKEGAKPRGGTDKAPRANVLTDMKLFVSRLACTFGDAASTDWKRVEEWTKRKTKHGLSLGPGGLLALVLILFALLSMSFWNHCRNNHLRDDIATLRAEMAILQAHQELHSQRLAFFLARDDSSQEAAGEEWVPLTHLWNRVEKVAGTVAEWADQTAVWADQELHHKSRTLYYDKGDNDHQEDDEDEGSFSFFRTYE